MPWLGTGWTNKVTQRRFISSNHGFVTGVAKVDIIDACRGRDAVKLQRIECVRHLFDRPSVAASAGNVAIAPKRVGCFETMSASCSLIRLASWAGLRPVA